ncbi:MAG: ExeM/NucH family extracellular endonuclease [Microcoleaceae cyanobacterium]
MAPSTLSSGDIAVVGFNFDDSDAFAFVPLVDLGTGTEIKFTDNGWLSAGGFGLNEGTFTWTAPADIAAGTVVSPAVSSVAFSSLGDQILAYQGDNADPTFIYALNSEGNPGQWQSNATNSRTTSALPTGLVDTQTAVALDEIDNAVYAGITSGTSTELLAAISNKSNWSGSNRARQTLPTAPFNILDGGQTPLTPIYEIQGIGGISPLNGQRVTTQGIVVGDFQGSDQLRGFFFQDPVGDGDSNTSDGIFTFVPPNSEWFGFDVQEGQLVEISGRVSEFNGRTQISLVTDIQIEEPTPDPLAPTPVSLPETTDGELEQFESMLVEIDSPMTITQNFFLGRYGQMTLASPDDAGNPGRLFQPTNQFRPLTEEAISLAEENARRLLFLDDGQDINGSGDNPNPVPYIGSPDDLSVIRSGDTINNLVGVLDFGRVSPSNPPDVDYRVQPTVDPVFTPDNPRTSEPAAIGGSLRVGAFNLENYFNGNGVGDFVGSRGAQNQVEFERQRSTIVPAILGLDPDILGVTEMQNNGFGADSAIQDLVNGLNDATAPGTYVFIDPETADGRLGTDVITVGFIYKPEAVDLVGEPEILDSTVDPRFNTSIQRPSLAQTFEEIGTGEEFTISVAHLKSKSAPISGTSPDPRDLDQGDGQAFFNFTRTQATEALVDWLATDPTGSGDPDFLIIGDLNAYGEEDPAQAIEDGGYTDLIRQFQGDAAYSFLFRGQSGYIDHAFASPSLVDEVTGATEWHINVDEPTVLGYSTRFNPEGYFSPDPYRSSDHDPLVVGLNLTSAPGRIINGTPGRDNLVGTSGNDIITGFQNRDRLTGGEGNDIFAYTTLADAGDVIDDFTVNLDKIDLIGVLNSIGFAGTDPIAEGYVSFRASGDDTILNLDADGFAGSGQARSLVLVKDVSVAELNNADNFLFG